MKLFFLNHDRLVDINKGNVKTYAAKGIYELGLRLALGHCK